MNVQQQIKHDLACAYYLLAQQKMDDQTYTHLSARIPGEDAYYIFQLGHFFQEVTPDNLLKVSLDGEILEGPSTALYNQTAYVIHGSIYKSRPDLNAIFHLHSIAGVAVSSMKCGLLPISQFALHFYNRLSCYNYDALALDINRQGHSLSTALGLANKACLLTNHGTLTCGTTIAEAYLQTQFLEKACRTQIAALNVGIDQLHIPSAHVCEQAYNDMCNFESNLGARDFTAAKRNTRFPWIHSG